MQAKIVNFATHMESTKEFKKGMDFTVKTFAGLEEALATELKELGADDVEIIKRGATFRGDEELMYKINYMSRLAVRVLKPIGVFEVKGEEQLYEKVRKINWMDVFNLNQTFSVDANLFHSDMDHSHYAALKTKDAIVDQFRDATGKRPWVNVETPDIYIDVHISHNVCTISLDSSGESLHRREYKIAADKAPINEVLAAGMINLSGWKCDVDFYDPMCGSGTIPIEAAMLAMKIPAGYYRKKFAFMSWDGHNEELWKKVKQEADDGMVDAECEIFASDRSEKAVAITKRNLKHAGLHKDINISVKYFDSVKPETGGVLIMNPPYGIRMEERGELRDLYKGIGDVLKQNFMGFDAWVISPNFETAKFIGLRPSQKVTLYNGPIETRFLKFEVYEGTRRYGDKSSENYQEAGADNEKSDNETKDDKFKRSDNRRSDYESNYKKDSYKRSDDSKYDKPKRDDDSEEYVKRTPMDDRSMNRNRDFDKATGETNPEKRRKINAERSKNFDRHMDSLRRFTRSDSKTDGVKKPGRKRISGKRPRKDDKE
ncbi:MAG: THUMP domain-containing protein [Bacteroidota bacterium]